MKRESSNTIPTPQPIGRKTKGTRLSRSAIWDLQRQYFDQFGQHAWEEGQVPSYGTSNAYAAQVQATLAHALIADINAAHDETNPTFRILELGGGNGRFAHLFLNALQQLQALQTIDLRYYLSDFTTANVASYANHPILKQWIDQGIMHPVVFDLENDGQQLPEPERDIHWIVIANYVFDSVPHDLFEIKDGELFEHLVLATEVPLKAGVTNPLKRIHLSLESQPAKAAVYTNARFNKILQAYQLVRTDLAFSFPISTLQFMERIALAHPGRVTFFVADKGVASIGEMKLNGIPHPAQHGSISVPVNFDAIGRYTRSRNWQAWEDKAHREHLHLNVYGMHDIPCPSLETTYQQIHRILPPDNFIALRKVRQVERDTSPISSKMALLDSSAADPLVFLFLYRDMVAQLTELSIFRQKRLIALTAQVLQNAFLDEPEDPYFACGTFFAAMGQMPSALSAYELSLHHFGEDEHVWYNMALCYVELNDPVKAAEWIQRVRQKNKDFPIDREIDQWLTSSETTSPHGL